MNILQLAPSLVQFLEASATSCQDAGPKREAIEVLQNALQLRTDPKSKFGLHWHILGVLDERLQKTKNGMTKEAINMAIFNHILGHSTKSCLVLSKGHSKVNKHPKQTYLPETLRWDGLALGK